MIDPVTALAGATKAFAVVKAMVEVGRSAEDTMLQIGTWYGHASDILYAEKKAKNVNPFKKIVFSSSVQAEAVNAFAAKKKLETQQKELISIIGMAYGKQGLQEFRDIRKQIARERQETIYRQQELREQITSGFLLVVMIVVLVGLIVFLIGA
tara:strand:+ start:170 stop:628 length:459 start_codon:yes stop_codon:yes gene_type:complete